MKNYRLVQILSIMLIALPLSIFAQQYPCITHQKTNEILEHSLKKRALLEQLNREALEYTTEHYGERAGGLKIIPTVIHVIHDYGSENLSKAAIINALESVNSELRGQNGSLNSIVSDFENIIADSEFELRLAKIDANGNCTDGITRTVSTQTYSAGEGVKDLINWNDGSRRYLQVWIVNSVGSGAGGYTYLPGSVNSRRNGIIIRAAQFQSTVTHEFGHWLNLKHTWGGSNNSAEPSNCNDDDSVFDTPNTIGSNLGCNTNQMSCGSLDNVQNFMDYSSCPRMLTLGQKARMQSASDSNIGGRNTYWGSSNRASTGTSDGFVNACVPTIDFALGNALGCEGLEVEFDDNSWGADEDASWVWSWSFPGGTPSSSDDPNPTITYNSAGTYNVTLTITTSAGANSETLQQAVVVTELGGGIINSFFEGAENSDFPNNSNSALEWSIETEGGLTWSRTGSVSFTGDASARINLRSITEGKVNSLISPSIDMSDIESADASMTFRLAHSNRTSENNSERLRVYASRNCGETWTLRYTKSGDNLNTAGGFVTSTFVPDANDWREETVSLATMAGDEHVLIKFEALSDRQSYLYIDDININPSAATGIEESNVFSDISVFPNPINGNSQLELVLKESTDAEIVLINLVGQQLAVKTERLIAGTNRVSINEWNRLVGAGIYLIEIRSDSGIKTVRFVKN